MLDSPLLAQFAPELVPFREKVTEIGTGVSSCTACEQRRRLERLTKLQIEISELVESNPAVKALVPQLIASAKQVANDPSSGV